MLASITPLGERARGHRWFLTSVIHIFGAAVGGAAIGIATSLLGVIILGSMPLPARIGLVAAALTAGLGWELVGRSVPGPRRQVDERWMVRYRRWVYASGYGVQLGMGVSTIVVTSSVYAIWLASFASADPVAGALIGVGAGAMRGASVLGAARIVSPARLMAFHKLMAVADQPTRRVALAAQLGLAAVTILIAVSA